MAGGATVLKLTASEKDFTLAMERASGALGKFTADANIKLSKMYATSDRVTTQMNRGLSRLSNTLKSFSLAGLVGVSAPLAFLAKSASDAYAELDSLKRGMSSLDPSISGVSARMKELEGLARLPALGFQEALKADIRMRTVGFTIAESTKIMKEFSNAVAKTGGGASNLGEVTYQLTQMAAKGKVLSQDLRPIIENAPAVGGALKAMFGTTSSKDISDKLSSQGKTSVDFIRMLLEELAKAPRVTGGWRSALENLGDTLFRVKARTLETYDRLNDLTGKIGQLERAVNELHDWFQDLPDPMKKLIGNLVLLAGVTPLVTFAVAKLIDAYVMLSRNLLTVTGTIGIFVTVFTYAIAKMYGAKVAADEFNKSIRSTNEIRNEAVASAKVEVATMSKLVQEIQKTKVGSDEYKNIRQKLIDQNPNFGKALQENTADFKSLRFEAVLYAKALVAIADQQALSTQISANNRTLGNKKLEIQDIVKNGANTDFSLQNLELLLSGVPILNGGFANAQITKLAKEYRLIEVATNKMNEALIESIKKNGNSLNKDFGSNVKGGGDGDGGDKKSKAEKEKEARDKYLRDLERHNKGIDDFLAKKIKRLEAHDKNLSEAAIKRQKKIDEDAAQELKNLNEHNKNVEDAAIKRQKSVDELADKEEKKKKEAIDVKNQQNEMLNEAIFAVGTGALGQLLNEDSNGFQKALKSQLGALGDYAIKLGIAGKKIAILKNAMFANPSASQATSLILAGIAMKAISSSIRVNRLAQGGVTNGNPIFSILGDNPSGKEMALPFEKTGEFAKSIAKQMGGGGTGGGTLTTKVSAREIKLTLNRLESYA